MQTMHRKAGSRLSAIAALPEEEQIHRLIITPRQAIGQKLNAQLVDGDANRLATVANMPKIVERRLTGRAHLLKIHRSVGLSEARAIAARLAAMHDVELAEPDRIMRIDSVVPADPIYASSPGQWHYQAPDQRNTGGADLPDAWGITLGSATMRVAVLDTGMLSHRDLAGMLPGYDFVSSASLANDGNGRDSDASDPGDWVAAGECGSGTAAANSSWHGTHVAGTIAAQMNNGLFGTGIAPNVKLLPVRVLGKCGGYTSDIIDAMRWAAGIDVPGVPRNRNPARILNLSFGSPGSCSAAFQSAINDVNAAGAIVVVANGNGGGDSANEPANCSGIVAVTAHAIGGDNTDYANIGPGTTLSAPGGGCGALSSACVAGQDGAPVVVSLGDAGTTRPLANSAAYKYGTSMAASHVSGTMALMLSLDPGLTRAQIISILRASARPHPASSACALSANAGLCGAGLLDAQAALTAVIPTVEISQPRQIVRPAASVTLRGSAQAPSGRTITHYQWQAAASNPVPVMLTTPWSAETSFIAPASGTYLFTLEVTDSNDAVATATATVKVNSAPVLLPPPAQTIEVGATLRVQLEATDADGDPPLFSATSLPAGASLSATGLLSWPSAASVGTYRIGYEASDVDSRSAPGLLSVTVTPSQGKAGGGGSLEGDLILVCGVIMAVLRRCRRKP